MEFGCKRKEKCQKPGCQSGTCRMSIWNKCILSELLHIIIQNVPINDKDMRFASDLIRDVK